ncbi:MAG: CtsR family transcriptional regulator [Clostridiales bacterium]|nr:CtsR family transcriptional regulator [Clostridiales bacterium]
MSISDIIEQFILDSIGDDEFISISRNQLADFFKCVPSQINYVLATRFTIDKGFIVESKRGGGGYIIISRLPDEDNIKYITSLVNNGFLQQLSQIQADQILDRLLASNLINARERKILSSAFSDKALLVPDSIKPSVRANILKNILVEILKNISQQS